MTGGAVQRMYHDDNTPGSVVQVLDIRRLSTDNPVAVERFRLVVSDGQHYQQAVVVTELNARIKSGEIQTLGLIKLTEIFCKVVMGRRVIIIFGLEVMSCPVEKLGKPSNVDPNVGTIQQPPSAQQPQCLHERQLQEQTGQLMDDWCCREFCNKAGCVSAGGSWFCNGTCWFEWGVELVLRFLRGCAVAEPDTKASYLVERCGVDPAIVAECLLVAQRRHGSPVFCHNALMDLIRRPGNGANVGRAQSVCHAAEGHVSLAQVMKCACTTPESHSLAPKTPSVAKSSGSSSFVRGARRRHGQQTSTCLRALRELRQTRKAHQQPDTAPKWKASRVRGRWAASMGCSNVHLTSPR